MIFRGADSSFCGQTLSALDAVDARGRILCAFAAAMMVSYLHSLPLLAAAGAAALIPLLIDGRKGVMPVLSSLSMINKIAALTWFLLPFTYPGARIFGVFSEQGIRAAFLIILKLNIISVIVLRLVASMGTNKINDALAGIGIPPKMRAILILSVRYVFMLTERMSVMTRAIRLRAPEQGLVDSLKSVAYMTGTTLIHCSDRAERSSAAFALRGGLNGFSGLPAWRWRVSDTFFCGIFFLFLAALAAAEFSLI